MAQHYQIGLTPSLLFSDAGICHGRPGYVHLRRTSLHEPEIFVIEEGSLCIECDEDRVEATPGTVLFHPAGAHQRGYAPSPRGVKFVWVHFTGIIAVASNAGRTKPTDLAPAEDAAHVTIPTQCRPTSFPEILNYAYLLAEKRTVHPLEKSLLTSLLLCRIASDARSEPRDKTKREKQLDDIRYVVDRYISTDITTATVARELSLNPTYLNRVFKHSAGLTITEYILRRKMEQAARLLSTGRSVKETSFYCGYQDPKYFTRRFREFAGIPPSQYAAGKAAHNRNF